MYTCKMFSSEAGRVGGGQGLGQGGGGCTVWMRVQRHHALGEEEKEEEKKREKKRRKKRERKEKKKEEQEKENGKKKSMGAGRGES